MIPVHRHNHPEAEIWINPDMIQQIETTPDTVVLLTNETRLVVLERPEEIAARIREWRASIVRRVESPEIVKKVVALPTTGS
jgi:flagellar protein FlbD